jgi:hypothetical protein
MQKFFREFALEFVRAACEGPRLYFAPVLGIVRQVRREIRRVPSRRGQGLRCKGASGDATPTKS